MQLFLMAILISLPFQAGDKPNPKVPTCSLTIIDAPTVEKLRLGMSVSELLMVLPKEDGDSLVNLIQSQEARNSPIVNRNGEHVWLETRYAGGKLNSTTYPRFKARVYLWQGMVEKIIIYYEDAVWVGTDGIIEYLRKGTALPEAKDWEENGTGKTLRCDGMQIDVVVSGEPQSVGTVYMTMKERPADKSKKNEGQPER